MAKHPPVSASANRRVIGERIKAARSKSNLTQRQLAHRLNVSAGAVGQWKTGKVSATGRLGELAVVLGVSLDWLLGTQPHVVVSKEMVSEDADDLALIREARRLGINLEKIVAEARQRRWIEENRDALADANAFIERHGLWSDGKRQF